MPSLITEGSVPTLCMLYDLSGYRPKAIEGTALAAGSDSDESFFLEQADDVDTGIFGCEDAQALPKVRLLWSCCQDSPDVPGRWTTRNAACFLSQGGKLEV